MTAQKFTRIGVLQQLAALLEQKFEVAPGKVTLESTLYADLGIGADPLGQVEFMELQAGIEQTFEISVPDTDVPQDPIKVRAITIKQIVNYICKKLGID